ncbi:MAG: AraC family transcriptional regulator [Pseudomonadota bacterium]
MTSGIDVKTTKSSYFEVQDALNSMLDHGFLAFEENTVYDTGQMQAARFHTENHACSVTLEEQLLLVATSDNEGHLDVSVDGYAKPHETTSGMLYFVPAGVHQDYEFEGTTRNTLTTLDMSILQKVREENVEFRTAPIDEPRFPFRNPRLMRKMNTLVELASKQDMGWRSLTDACNTQIAVELLKSLSNAVERVARPLGRADLAVVREYVHSHLEQNVGLEEVAGLMGRDIYGFGRAFKSATGQTFHQYITRLRVQEARRLLTSTTMPIIEVAYACGFSSQAHLTTVVGRHIGLTPGALRQQAQA